MADWKNIKHDVTIRNEPRAMVEVDVEPVDGQLAFEQHLKRGKQTILVYESQLAELERLTQTERDRVKWAAAVESYEAKLAHRLEGVRDERARERIREAFGESPASIMRDMDPKWTGMPPFRSSRVLERNVPPPETLANIQANQFGTLADVIAKAIAAASTQPAKAR